MKKYLLSMLTLLALCNVLNAQTYVDEMTEETTRADAYIVGDLSFEVYYGDVENARWGDPTYVMRRYMNQDASINYSNDGKVSVLEGKKMTGIKINLLCGPWGEYSREEILSGILSLTYITDDGDAWTRSTDYAFDYIYDANKGEGWWEDWYLQTALPANVVDVKLTLLGGSHDPWVPLLRRVEIFYEDGTEYAYQKPEGAYNSIPKIQVNKKTFNISAKEGKVQISNVSGKQVSIYGVEGKCVFSSLIRTDFVELPLNSGIYLVKAGNETQKIIVTK